MDWILDNLEEVRQVLENHPAARDNDFVLYYHVLMGAGVSPKRISARELLIGMSTRKLPHFDSITRVRRKLQEEHEHLRGKRWVERHRLAEEVKTHMTN